jgi:hypothetical protein
MLLRRLSDPPRTLISLGMFCLVAGATTGTLLRHNAPLSPFWDQFGDGIFGMFYGMSIALMLIGFRLKARARRRG